MILGCLPTHSGKALIYYTLIMIHYFESNTILKGILLLPHTSTYRTDTVAEFGFLV